MPRHTKDKGGLACAITIADLSRKIYVVLTPVVSGHLPFDIIAYEGGKCQRIQCKYRLDGFVKRGTSWVDKNDNHIRHYRADDFDYYALYLHQPDVVVYPSVHFAGRVINHAVPRTLALFHWYEDFRDLTDCAERRTYKELQGAPGGSVSSFRWGSRKVERLSVDDLQELLWKHPTSRLARQFGVTDKAIEKWAEAYGLRKPPRGYWSKVRAQAKEG